MDQSHTALVTGAASGIGLATARRLAKRDVAVVIGDINREAGEVAAQELNDAGHRALFVELDVGSRDAWNLALATIETKFGSPDILINNAGVFRDKSLLKMSDDDWDIVQQVNLKGAWLGAQTVFPGMKEKRWGRMVNISSSAHRGNFGQTNYSASKAGLIGLTRTLALEGVRNGILVNAVAPHNCDTPILKAVPEKDRQEWMKASRMGRFAEPEEVAAVIDFFASDDNSYVSGQLLEIDGTDLVGAG